MNSSLLSFPLFGFTVNVQATFLFLLAIFSLSAVGVQDLSGAVGWLFVLPLGIIVHELGHAVVARRFGLRVGDIELNGLGGLVRHSATTPARQLAISLAGPFAGFALGAVALGIGALMPQSRVLYDVIIEPMATVTFFYGLLNLLPAFPLDGGMALRSALAVMFNDRIGLGVTGVLGVGVGALGVMIALRSGAPFLGLLAAFLAWTNLQVLQGLSAPKRR